MIKGVICDLDGFLVQTWGTEPLPGVLEALATLKQRGISLAVASNQAGPLWRAATGQEKYPNAAEVATRLLAAAGRLGLEDASWYVSVADGRALGIVGMLEGAEMAEEAGRALSVALSRLKAWVSADARWRKPEPGMLLCACELWNLAPAEAIYGGDLDSDRQAAEAAGMRFVERLADVLPLLDTVE